MHPQTGGPPSRVRSVLSTLLDNAFDLATIAIAIYLVVRHQFEPFGEDDVAGLMTWVVAALGLLGVSGVVERSRKLRRLDERLMDTHRLVESVSTTKARANQFLHREHSIKAADMIHADEIWLSGMTLGRTTRELLHVLGERLKGGASVRILIVEPRTDLSEEMSRRSVGNTTGDYWKQRHETVRAMVDVVRDTPHSQGQVELRALPYLPSFGIVAIDPTMGHGRCSVELYHHESSTPNPGFQLESRFDQPWYDFFIEQYETLWASAELVPGDGRAPIQ